MYNFFRAYKSAITPLDFTQIQAQMSCTWKFLLHRLLYDTNLYFMIIDFF